ncbi:hypothetical protein AXE80_06320 [Wenyingzhuangia fucanilytica]|uniref:Glyoxalase n=1 Tax=Wenyingzhuangia fucanilytica TaxID=1790137 RepID=A0A1B1Y560_9FLAO|nr:hypothetical protein [Wenyingzhuangia fucanilytica]ANW95916.1 hypothetical protein AXE80_06320 [Wenyingzhuangia fucanilytica]
MQNKQSLRPVITTAEINEHTSATEKFQNTVLRPVIKMQHHIIIALFNSYLKHSDFDINTLEKDKRMEFLKTVVSRNQHMRNQYVGIVSGMFTDEEFDHYLTNPAEYGRRIIQIIGQRLQDSY